MLRSLAIGIIVLATSVSAASAQSLNLSWYSIDCGGRTLVGGGSWQLGSTIGQMDAGAEMAGGSWRLAGGFWSGVQTAGQTPCPPDIDGDGLVGLSDLAILLSHFGTTVGGTDGDLDVDGDVDLADLATLLASFGTACP